jgi:hypothetical protein
MEEEQTTDEILIAPSRGIRQTRQDLGCKHPRKKFRDNIYICTSSSLAILNNHGQTSAEKEKPVRLVQVSAEGQSFEEWQQEDQCVGQCHHC